MNILGEQIFVHLILHIYNRIKRNNICPPRPHIDQYIWARIFLFIYWKTYLEKKHLFTLFLPLLATFLQWWKPRLIAGRQSKRSPKNMIIVIMIIMFTHDYNHHIHSWSCWLSGRQLKRSPTLRTSTSRLGWWESCSLSSLSPPLSVKVKVSIQNHLTLFLTFSTSRSPWNIFF